MSDRVEVYDTTLRDGAQGEGVSFSVEDKCRVAEHTAASGTGPVNALDHALRRALEKFYPALAEVRLLDYKVRVLSGSLTGTASLVRVLITSGDGRARWGTVGVSTNIVEASWRALVDAVEYKLVRDGVEPESGVQTPDSEVRDARTIDSLTLTL